MERPLIVLPDPVHDVAVELLRSHFHVLTCEEVEGKLGEALAQADAILIRSFKMPADVLQACPRLKVIAKHGAGIDSIDLDMAGRLGVVVANVPGGNARAVAEATVALMLGAIWRTPEAHDFVKSGQFQRRWELHFEQLTDRVLGLVGFGNIGERVARMCRGGFNMTVLAHDPFVDAGRMSQAGVEKVEDIGTILRTADVVSLHLPLTPETHHLIGREQLQLMKKSAVLVNAARGKLVDGKALREALQEGWIAGAGLDVFEVEPPPADDPLLQAPHLAMSPHTAGSTIEVEKSIGLASAQIAIDVLAGRRPKNLVNPQVWQSRRT